MAKSIGIIHETSPEFNIHKTEIFWPSCNGSKLCGEFFPSDIGRPVLGMKFLGGAVSQYEVFIEGLFTKREVEDIELMYLLPQLRDPKSEILLL